MLDIAYLCFILYMPDVSKVDFILVFVIILQSSGTVFCCEISSVQSSHFLLRQCTGNKTIIEEIFLRKLYRPIL
jgi:hypothetical protein